MKKLVLALILAMGTAQASDRAGTIIAARGDVTNATGHPLLQGSIVYTEDEITALDKSFAVVQFYDGAKMTVRPNSTVAIKAYSEEDVDISLVSGGLRLISGAIAKAQPENVKIQTHVALMGVRGTELSIQYIE